MPTVAVLPASSKALTPIEEHPLIWHAMMQFAGQGLNRFAIAGGDEFRSALRGEDQLNISIVEHGPHAEGGRLLELRQQLGSETVLLITGEHVSDIDLLDLLRSHRSHGRLATIVAIRPPARFGKLEINGDQVVEFCEKPEYEQGWIGAPLCLLEPGVFDYVIGDEDWDEVLTRLAADDELMAYRHSSFWGSVETLRDRQELEELWKTGAAPWKTWK